MQNLQKKSDGAQRVEECVPFIRTTAEPRGVSESLGRIPLSWLHHEGGSGRYHRITHWAGRGNPSFSLQTLWIQRQEHWVGTVKEKENFARLFFFPVLRTWRDPATLPQSNSHQRLQRSINHDYSTGWNVLLPGAKFWCGPLTTECA